MTVHIPVCQIDAFADEPFTGNPAAVCLLDRFPADQWLQAFAAEMNLSETAFVVPTADANRFHLRWFTPLVEVDLCGHATLAAAHVLYENAHADPGQPIQFESRSGALECSASDGLIHLDFPSDPPRLMGEFDRGQRAPTGADESDATVSQSALFALGLQAATCLRAKFDLLVVVPEESQVLELEPDFSALSALDVRGVIVSARSGRAGVDFLSRFFAPQCGINEDPVTGSAHCCLAPYWGEILGRAESVGYQASQRGGIVRCRVQENRVHLAGQAITVIEGRVCVEPAFG